MVTSSSCFVSHDDPEEEEFLVVEALETIVTGTSYTASTGCRPPREGTEGACMVGGGFFCSAVNLYTSPGLPSGCEGEDASKAPDAEEAVSALSSACRVERLGVEIAPERFPIGTFGVMGDGVAYILDLLPGGLRGTLGLSLNIGGLGVITGLAPGRPLRQDVEAYRADFWIPAVGVGTSGCDFISRRKSEVS